MPQNGFKVQGRKFLYPSSGFTLIELLVALAIMTVLTTVALAGYNNFNARQQVKNFALELQADLRKYQSFALSGNKTPVPGNNTCVSQSLQYYGLTVTSNQLRAYIQCTSIAPVLISTKNLPTGITATIQSGGSSCTNATHQVRFATLNNQTSIHCTSSTAQTPPAEVLIQLTGSGVTYGVYVTSQGRVYAKKMP